MSAVIEIPDDGIIQIRLPSGESVAIDTYETWNQICAIRDRHTDEDKPTHEFHTQVVVLLESKGLPRFNHFQADRLVQRIGDAVDELKKAVGTVATPASQPSTVPVS